MTRAPLVLFLLSSVVLLCNALSVNLYSTSVNLTYYTDETFLYGTVTHDYLAWLGLGWHAAGDTNPPSLMFSTDYVIAQFNSDGSLASIADYVTAPSSDSGETAPVLDTSVPGCTNDIIAYAGFQTPTGTSFSFKKRLRTNDTLCDRPITNASQIVVWARGPNPGSNTLGFHGGSSSTHGSASINFLSASSSGAVVPSPGPDYAPLHAALMFAAFGVFMPFGIFIGRYLKRYWWWFPLHITVQCIALITALISFSFALKMVGKVHFRTVHSKVGFTALCLSTVAPVIGVIADRLYDPKRSSLPWWPDYSHWIVGRLAVFFGWTAIILGILLIGLPKSDAIATGCLWAIYLAIYFSMDLMKRYAGNDITPAGSDPINAPLHD